MRKGFAKLLVCPICRGELACHCQEERQSRIWTGELKCPSCLVTYPVIQGIPRMLPQSERDRDQHWEELHKRADYAEMVKQVKRRFGLPQAVLWDYYAHARLVRDQKNAPGRVLELGAGSGSYSLALHHLVGVQSVTLLDISISALEGSRKIFTSQGLAADYVQGDIRCLPFVDRAFDLVMSGGLIEHFAGEEQVTVAREHGRVAKRVLIEAPAASPAYWLFRLLYSLRPGGWPFGFEQPLTRGRMRHLLLAAGFIVEAWGGHDFAAAVELMGRLRWPVFPRLHRWPGAAWISRHDRIVLARWPESDPAH